MLIKMKIVTLCILLIMPISSYANEVEISTVKMYCVEKSNNAFKYKIFLILKNTSKKKIRLITKSSGSAAVLSSNGDATEIIVTYGEKRIGGIPIIPTDENLGIVVLRSGEGAQIEHVYLSRKEVNSAIIQYNATAIYNHRFKNWVGSIKSKKIKPIRIKSCKP